MADILDKIAAFQKAHDYFGKGKTLFDSINTVIKASKIDPKDPIQLGELVGITDKETRKLMKVLTARAKAADAMVRASFPEVPSETLGTWMRWLEAVKTYGDTSPQAEKARGKYIEALEEHDYLLAERISYCDLLVKLSTQQMKIYRNLTELHERAEAICLAVIASPSVPSTAPAHLAMKTILKFQGIRGPAKSIWKSHETMIRLAKAEKAKQQAAREENLVWLNHMRMSSLTSMVKKTMKAFGVPV